MRKKELKIIAISSYVGFALAYLCFAFALADLNPCAWSASSRFFMLILGFLFNFICAGVALNIGE